MFLVHFLVDVFIAFAIFFPIVLFVITLYRAYREDGNPTNINMFLGLLLLLALTCSCTVDEYSYHTCMDNSCNAVLEVPGTLDSNGYYHIDLDWNGENYPRFNILVDASLTNRDFWYNNSPVIQASFETDTFWKLGNDILPIVQSDRVMLSKYSETRASGKRILGPFPPEMKGDTIEVAATVWWEAGIDTKGREILVKFIVE